MRHAIVCLGLVLGAGIGPPLCAQSGLLAPGSEALPHLLERGNVIEVPRNRNGQMMLMEAFQFNDHVIFGATARMLRNFLNVTVKDLGELASRPI